MSEVSVTVGSMKDTNPKDAVGIKKVPFSTVPLAVFIEAGVDLLSPAVAMVGLAMLEGGRKYGRHNYRVVGVRASVYVDAAFRHEMADAGGQVIDPESGLRHKVKTLSSLVVLRDAMLNGKCTDDRPPPVPGIVHEGVEIKVVNILSAWWEGMDVTEDGDSLVTCIKLLSAEINKVLAQWSIEDLMEDMNRSAARIVETVRPDDPKPPYTAKDVAA